MGANVVIADKHKDTPNIAKNFGGFGYVCDVTKEEELNSFITFARTSLVELIVSFQTQEQFLLTQITLHRLQTKPGS